jgi:hypothetical protein
MKPAMVKRLTDAEYEVSLRDERKDREIAALKARIAELEGALRDLFGADMEELMMRDGKDDQIEAIANARRALEKKA